MHSRYYEIIVLHLYSALVKKVICQVCGNRFSLRYYVIVEPQMLCLAYRAPLFIDYCDTCIRYTTLLGVTLFNTNLHMADEFLFVAQSYS